MQSQRTLIIQITFILIALIYLGKLFYLQVTNNEYKLSADNSIVQKITVYPYRGLIFDRDGKLLVYNQPVYDLMVRPKNVSIKDTARFCDLLDITREKFLKKMQEAKNYSYLQSSVFIKKISNKKFATIQDHLVDYKGFYARPRTDRAYPHNCLANTLGYTREIDPNELERDTEDYYRAGDYVGKTGLEKYYERYLRGERGKRYITVNARGMEMGSFKEGKYDSAPEPGKNLKTTIDLELQRYGEKLMDGKVGSIVAIKPSTGGILSTVSSPSYNPGLLTGKQAGKYYNKLAKDSTKPLLNRPVQSKYPPGSIFKTLQASVALEENVIEADEWIYCSGNLIGDHAPPGHYNVHKGIVRSSNNYFYKVFKRIIQQGRNPNRYIDSRLGLNNWVDYVKDFGLGSPLGIDLPSESGGKIPTSDYYDRIYGRNRWKFSTIASLSIGQGEILLTPLQMANMASIMANRGHYYTPHLVKGIGEKDKMLPRFKIKNNINIDSNHFNTVVDAMADAVHGTARRAVIKDIEVCGKTGTAENPHGEDHSVFMAFAPRKDPQIAVAVFVENAGWGGRAAASTASLMIEKYIRGHISKRKKWLEDYVLKGDFL